MNQRTLKRILSTLPVLLAIACGSFGPPEFHDIKADITSIEKASDTSVVVNFEIYSSGDADDCSFYVVYDTLTLYSRPNFHHLIMRSNRCRLAGISQVTVHPIVRGKRYYYQLGEDGDWEVDGQTSSRAIKVGNQYEYVLK